MHVFLVNVFDLVQDLSENHFFDFQYQSCIIDCKILLFYNHGCIDKTLISDDALIIPLEEPIVLFIYPLRSAPTPLVPLHPLVPLQTSAFDSIAYFAMQQTHLNIRNCSTKHMGKCSPLSLKHVHSIFISRNPGYMSMVKCC